MPPSSIATVFRKGGPGGGLVPDFNTNMQLCMFAGGTRSTLFPSFGRGYGVFGPPDLPNGLATGFVHTDDEDGIDNRNAVGGLWQGSDAFLAADRNTTLLTIKVH